MKSLFKVLSVVLTVVIVISCFAGCSNVKTPSDDVVILFTGNVNNEASAGVGYAGVAAYKADMLNNHNLVATVDLGNSLSGGMLDLVSNGEYASQIMNEVGYDYYVPGTKDVKLNLDKISEDFNSKLISSTISYNGESDFEIASFVNVEFSGITVGLVGVSAMGKTTANYDLATIDNFTQKVNEAVVESKTAGADYIVLLSNIPVKTAEELANEVNDVDVILNAAKSCAQKIITREDGKKVIYSSCGKKLTDIGQLIITRGGTISTTVIKTTDKDEDTELVVKNLDDKYNQILLENIGSVEYNLPIANEAGIRLVKSRETAIGNFIADAYRKKTNADIAFVSANEIGQGIAAGDLNLADVMSILPAKNILSVSEMTGEQIIDTLEYAVKNVTTYYASLGQPLGEFDGFLQVSGIMFNVNTLMKSAVNYKEDGSYDSLSDMRRVSNVKVLNAEGEYVEIDPLATYTVVGTKTLLNGESNGNVLAGSGSVRTADAGYDYEAVLEYIKGMENTKIVGYESTEGRMIIR